MLGVEAVEDVEEDGRVRGDLCGLPHFLRTLAGRGRLGEAWSRESQGDCVRVMQERQQIRLGGG